MELKALLAGKPLPVTVEWGGQEVNLTYDPSAYTPKLEAEVLKAAQEGVMGAGSMAIATLVADLVVAWDVTSEGEPFPPIVENLATLPVALLGAIVRKIAEALGSNPLLSGTSDEPS